MSITFDRTGDCPRPAVTVVEGYTPLDRRAHGSLDVVVHACQECAQETRKRLDECGMTPYSLPLPQGFQRACGERMAFQGNAYTAVWAGPVGSAGDMRLLSESL
jgi:hypothetical protein